MFDFDRFIEDTSSSLSDGGSVIADTIGKEVTLNGIIPYIGDVAIIADALSFDVKEIEYLANTGEQLWKVAKGDYAKDANAIKENQDKYEEEKNNVSKMSDDLVSIVMLYDEVYQMAGSNEIDRYIDTNLKPLEIKLQKQIDDFNSSYGEIIKMQGTFLGDIFLSPFMIIGGIAYDFGNMVSGDIDATLRIVGLIVSIVLLVITLGSDYSSLAKIVATLAVYLSMDSTFGQGGIMTATMQILDFAFNEVLHADTYINETDRFKKGSEYYEETKGYVSLTLSITAIVATLDYNAIMRSFDSGKEMAQIAGKEAAKSTAQNGNLTNLLQVVQQATSYAQSYSAHEKLKAELNDRIVMLEERQARADRKYRAQMLQDSNAYITPHQERVDNYEYNFDNGVYQYKDPMYLVPFEQVDGIMTNDNVFNIFNENKLAGSDNYFKNMLYS